jgi:hypothetical protein
MKTANYFAKPCKPTEYNLIQYKVTVLEPVQTKEHI